MSSEYIRKSVQALAGYTPGEQPGESGVIKLNTNENPYPPSPAVTEALKGLDVERLRLYPDPACTELRQQIGRLHGCSPEQVVVGNGSDEILALCLRAFVERDGCVGFFEPSYSLYPVLAGIEDLPVRPVPLGPSFDWTMPDDYRASLFFLTNPNAPTSLLFDRAEVASFCAAFSGVVVIDEAYVDFASEDCMHLALSGANVLVSRSLSKSYSLAGIRLGYAVGPPGLVAALSKIKDSYNVNAITQQAALAALRDPDTMSLHRERILLTRSRVTGELERRGFRVFPSEANFLWACPGSMSAEDLFEGLRARGILVRHFPGDSTGAYLRISIGTDAQMDALLSAIDEMPA